LANRDAWPGLRAKLRETVKPRHAKTRREKVNRER